MRARLVVAMLLVVAAAVACAAPVGAAPVVTPFFADVACPTATSCFAVGNTIASSNGTWQTLVEHWDGKQWSIMITPNAANTSQVGRSVLNDIACSSPTSCFTVGYAETRRGVRLARRPFVEHWNGKQWSIVASANPRGATYVELDSVSCVGGSKCFAVGWFSVGVSTVRPLAERWTGKAFSIVPSGRPQGSTDMRLFGVKCRTAADCVAVGQADGTAIVEHWSGAAWSVAAEPDAASKRFEELDSVSCPTATRCFAVGSYDDAAANSKALIVAGNGQNWSVVASDNPKGIRQSRLLDVGCPTRSGCVAVGWTDQGGQTAESTFVEHSVGDVWSRVASASPDHRPNSANVLGGVACPTAKSCFAVGTTTSGANPTSLILHWNGASWAVAAHPKPK